MSSSVINNTQEGFKAHLPVIFMLLLMCSLLSYGKAFNTGDIHYVHRFLIWSTLCAAILIQWRLFQRLMKHFFESDVLLTVSTFLVVWLVSSWQINELKLTGFIPKAYDPYAEFIWFTLPLLLSISLVIFFSQQIQVKSIFQSINDRPNQKETSLGGIQISQIDTLKAQEHYILISSSKQQKLIRCTLKYAIERLKQENGIQVHKSWWVRKTCVSSVQRIGRDMKLHMHNGQTVPVSRHKVSLLRKLGWFDH